MRDMQKNYNLWRHKINKHHKWAPLRRKNKSKNKSINKKNRVKYRRKKWRVFKTMKLFKNNNLSKNKKEWAQI